MLDATVEEKGKKRKLDDLEIVSYSMAFLVAGHETTAGTLAYTSYLLALNPNAQEKLCEEIDEYLDTTPDPFNVSLCRFFYLWSEYEQGNEAVGDSSNSSRSVASAYVTFSVT